MSERVRKLADVRAYDEDGKPSTYLISLEALCGHKVVDLLGYLSNEFDEPMPMFKICYAVLDNGTRICVEGEHDTPYLHDVPGVTDEELDSLTGEDND